jgi:hypothetical protein
VQPCIGCWQNKAVTRIDTLTPEPETPTDATDVVAMSVEMLRFLVGEYGAAVDLPPLAAIGITTAAWRRHRDGHAEEAHGGLRRSRINDGEMFAANVANTRLVLHHLRGSQVDWQAMADEFVDPNRVVGQRTFSDLLGAARHRRWSSRAWRYIAGIGAIADQHGMQYALLTQAFIGGHQPIWWGSPRWPQLVEAFIDQLTNRPPGMTAEDLRDGLLDGPDRLPTEILDWCASSQLIGYTRLSETPSAWRPDSSPGGHP